MIFKLFTPNYKPLVVVPIVLTLIFALIVFIYPGLTLGLDFVGGTRMIVNTDKLSEQPVQDLLANQLGIADSKITIVTGAFGTSARIEYSEPRSLTDARFLLESGAENKTDNPEAARSSFIQALSKLGITANPSATTEELLLQTSQAVNTASEKISSDVRAALISEFNLPANTEFTIEQVTPTFGANFLSNTIFVAIVSIVLLTIVIFIFFREFVPSIAIVLAALFDMLCALALLTLFGFSITLSVVAALLMVVGYAIDTNILLTTRLLKRKDKSILERTNDTLLTGLTITATLAGAALAMMAVSYTGQITVIFEIAATTVFGLFGDVIATWFMNAPILLNYWERKNGKLSPGTA